MCWVPEGDQAWAKRKKEERVSDISLPHFHKKTSLGTGRGNAGFGCDYYERDPVTGKVKRKWAHDIWLPVERETPSGKKFKGIVHFIEETGKKKRRD